MSFDETILHCSAPALCGIKPACLFSMNRKVYDSGIEKIRSWNEELCKEGTYIIPLLRSRSLVLLFVYNVEKLKLTCSTESAQRYLKSKGYKYVTDVQYLLVELLHRLSGEESFPHEVGLFLGYPLEDVIAFERTNGCGFRFSGLWKVYGNVEAARQQIEMYNACRYKCNELLNEGLSLPAIIRSYKIGC